MAVNGLVTFILILGVIVLIHELGHLLSAKYFNVYCREFAIGIGPKLFSRIYKETIYSVRMLPIGGFVAMAGEEGVDADIPVERSLPGIAPHKRLVIMLAGVFMNFLLATIIFIGIYVVQGQVLIAPQSIIAGVVEDSPAERAGFMTNDRVISIRFSDNTTIVPKDFYEIITYIQMYTDTSIFTVERQGQIVELTVTPVYISEENRYFLGLALPSPEIKEITTLEAIQYGVIEVRDTINSMLFTLTRLVRGIGLNSISGPIGIYQVASTQASYGFLNVLYLTALLSINVAIFNLLPLPILDGGRVVLTVFEMIFRKPVNKRIEQALMAISVSLLLLLMLFVTWQDLMRLF
jgi:regulator of sigma E protease